MEVSEPMLQSMSKGWWDVCGRKRRAAEDYLIKYPLCLNDSIWIKLEICERNQKWRFWNKRSFLGSGNKLKYVLSSFGKEKIRIIPIEGFYIMQWDGTSVGGSIIKVDWRGIRVILDHHGCDTGSPEWVGGKRATSCQYCISRAPGGYSKPILYYPFAGRLLQASIVSCIVRWLFLASIVSCIVRWLFQASIVSCIARVRGLKMYTVWY